ncbi:MAG: hypothetical protein DCF15_21085 [Phormidesmis priestleyi]|uniref:Uncharacterized protein n=1 Tax=Phormidesmis priestleyi TaxID=268141 RepID=A0A2W4YSS0_9CYAN|nr:MAG: hypothetical protein DCF15_21085 [Phormidesmis priestleyi]
MFEYLLPKSAKVQQIEDALELHRAAQEFRLEVERRQAQDQYCQWYYEMAEQTQAEAAAMESDFNFFGWFWGRKPD